MSTFDRSSSFNETRWSRVLRARSDDATVARRALEELCQLYWFPLYGFIRRHGHGAHDAQDLTQEFFRRFLERQDFDRADEGKGRLRSYLLGAVKHFLSNEMTRAEALKRGGNEEIISLDQDWAESQLQLEAESDTWSPDRLFDRRWALTQLDAARLLVRERFVGRGKIEQFEVLEKFLAWNGGEDYAAAARELAMTETAVRVAVHRLRERFRNALRQEIAHTVEAESDLEAEMRAFAQLLG
ncbi:MAG: RNA polymerase sigma factor (sigma-70 family) [Verrucomicrobiales bacterium]|jgi:RNA polymerase sigma factor (sigma-70 family)